MTNMSRFIAPILRQGSHARPSAKTCWACPNRIMRAANPQIEPGDMDDVALLYISIPAKNCGAYCPGQGKGQNCAADFLAPRTETALPRFQLFVRYPPAPAAFISPSSANVCLCFLEQDPAAGKYRQFSSLGYGGQSATRSKGYVNTGETYQDRHLSDWLNL